MKWIFLKFANVNFSNRIFSKIRGRNEILNKKFRFSVQFGIEFPCLFWNVFCDLKFLGPLTKTCRLGSRLLKVFFYLFSYLLNNLFYYLLSQICLQSLSSERKMKLPNPEIFNHENAEIPMLLFILIRLLIMPKISSWKMSAAITCW